MVLRHLIAVVLGVSVYYSWTHLTRDSDVKISFEDLPQKLQEWKKMGKFVTVNGKKMFYIHRKCSNSELKDPPTFVLIHGFPSSSYEYHKVIQDLAKHGDVVLNDHIGFGFSDAPSEGYTYSLSEAADNILAFWRNVGLKKAHFISHDMGDSVLTEILARRFRKMLPSDLENIFLSVTFTNGGMNFKMINFRISQIVFMYPKIARRLISVARRLGLTKMNFMKQIGSIWSPHANAIERDQDINDLYVLNLYNGAHYNYYNTNYYLWDRHHFEYKWFAALKEFDLPCRFVWSDSDDVSPISIPLSFENIVPVFDLTVVKDKGHFWMLEDPKRWVEEMIKIVK